MVHRRRRHGGDACPTSRIIALAALYSLGAHGIMTLNDFKSIDGDRRLGVRSLPVQLGVERAVRLACVVMAAPQVAVIGLLLIWGRPVYAALVGALLLGQFALMPRLLANPSKGAAALQRDRHDPLRARHADERLRPALRRTGPLMTLAPFGWPSIIRLGLVQTALGAVIVLMTSTINRVMVVELALPALVPGLLVASHYAIQILRPAWGYGSDVGGRRTPWIIGGMAALALGGIGAALGTAVAATSSLLGLALAGAVFSADRGRRRFGGNFGPGDARDACRAAPARRRGVGRLDDDDPRLRDLGARWRDIFSIRSQTARLIAVTATVCAIAFLVATLAVWGA